MNDSTNPRVFWLAGGSAVESGRAMHHAQPSDRSPNFDAGQRCRQVLALVKGDSGCRNPRESPFEDLPIVGSRDRVTRRTGGRVVQTVCIRVVRRRRRVGHDRV